ncbi:MAG: VCBS repeat-containing protein [bacterium]|nr:VCBS repeat-containing protein [bacterium]
MKGPFALLLLLLLAAPAASDDPPAPPPEAGVTVGERDGARLIEATLPGEIFSRTEARRSDGTGGLLLLVGGDGEPASWRALVFLTLADEGAVELIASDLPAAVDAVATVDLDGDGHGEVLLGEAGKIYSLGALAAGAGDREPVLILDAPHLDLGRITAGGYLDPGEPRITVPEIGRLTIFGWRSGRMEPEAEYELPIRARRQRTGLRLSTPPITALRREGSGAPLYVVGPEAYGKRRLLTLLIGPAGEGTAEAKSVEAYSWLPAPENVGDSRYVLLDGRPALIVTTTNAEKLGIFEKKKLRLFPLRFDRTRAGGKASFKTVTNSHHWQEADVVLADATGDGRDDLVIVGPAGLGEEKLMVVAYAGKGGGRFLPTPRKSVVVAMNAHWRYGSDIDVDGVPDLVARADDRVLIFSGMLDRKEKRVLESEPRWSIRLPHESPGSDHKVVSIDIGSEGASTSVEEAENDQGVSYRGRPAVRDLDGDGRDEILVHGRYPGGAGVVVIIQLQ